ncbi:MAG: hypothetical protein ACE5LV_04490 [Candidatus Aminicenantales bacterium]
MEALVEKLKRFFTQHPVLKSALQVSPGYISGVHLSPKERKLKGHFVLPLPEGVLRPSFEKPNIQEPGLLEKTIRENVEKPTAYDHGVALLIPELAQRTFVFGFTSLPSGASEREQLIRFRVKKQLPLLAQDVRIAYDVIPSGRGRKVVSSLARALVVAEYEQFFSRLRLRVRAVGVPVLALANLVDWEKEKNFLVLNIEKDAFGLFGATEGLPFLSRQKSLMVEGESLSVEEKIPEIVQEVENTVHFIEDREHKSIASVWVRFGTLEPQEGVLDRLQQKTGLAFHSLASRVPLDVSDQEKELLAPLVGQVWP